jgi:hypothetical protein
MAAPGQRHVFKRRRASKVAASPLHGHQYRSSKSSSYGFGQATLLQGVQISTYECARAKRLESRLKCSQDAKVDDVQVNSVSALDIVAQRPAVAIVTEIPAEPALGIRGGHRTASTYNFSNAQILDGNAQETGHSASPCISSH